ncbi:mucin-like protein [Octopus sinensis]|uniref:Mucin-like protein n=1 Tax=Octopus sinensis TaxID=2607531 RepID=A0A6P7T8E9_9MOLL|nr:mucin-like protein [Octopus sinensis]
MHSKALYITSLLLFIFYTSAQDITYSGDTTTAIETTYTDVTITTLLSTAAYTTLPTTIQTTEPPCTPAQALFQAGGIPLLPEDDTYQHLCFPVDVPINNEKVDCVYIYVNGLISTKPTFSYEAENLLSSDSYTFAPFWSDIDIRAQGSVSYREVEKYPVSRDSTTHTSLLGEINEFIKTKGQINNFDTVYALIVTWTEVIPHRAAETEKSLTFQFILATDGAFTYAAYIYDTCNATWDFEFDVAMGYAAGATNVYNNLKSLTDTIISDSLLPGREGEATWVFLVSSESPQNFKLQCLEWHWDNKDVQLINSNEMVQCPCTVNQMQIFVSFQFFQESGCYHHAMDFQGQSKICCYDENTGSLVRGNVEKNVYYNQLWTSEDYEPYQHCCKDSNYCNIFYENRPKDDCKLWQQQPASFMFGDPHFRTLDGLRYTFNGFGEFDLLNIFNSSDDSPILKIQCRTRKIDTGEATVFEAFAFKTPLTNVQVMTSLNAEAVVINENSTELTQFKSDKNFQLRQHGVFIRRPSPDKETYWISFSSGITASITYADKLLNIGISMTLNKSLIYTNGLLGTFNGNKTDDLQLRNKTYLSADSDEETIYRKFGLNWATTDSIFQYENGRTASSYRHLDYVPVFWSNNFTTNSTVNTFCKNEQSCIYDYVQTKDESIARGTRDMVDTIALISLLELYPPPVINGSQNVYLSENETLELEFNINYEKQYNISLVVLENNSSVITMSNDTVMVKLTASGENISAAFLITSDIGHKTQTFKLNIIVCPKCVNGSCEAESQFSNPLRVSQYLPCTCNAGWAGDDCSFDNRCAPFDCTNASTLERCICKCPGGYEYKDDKCVEINECLTQSPCEQNCINTQGSYSCSCNPGYIRNGDNCTDLDECKEQNDCQHNCANTNGSYSCSCRPGYALNADGKTCDKDASLNCSSCSAFHGCMINASNITTCFCDSGYDMNSTGCFDTDECSKYSGICGNATCVNTDPSYKCECSEGYIYDKSEKTCADCPKENYGKNCNKTCHPLCVACDKINGCVCESGKKGDNCSIDINECLLSSSVCDLNTTTCENVFGSYYCKCIAGYSKTTDTRCVDIDECAERKAHCSANAICTNTIGSYKCTCKKGFSGNGSICDDINECNETLTNVKHNCSQICEDTDGSYACKCRPGYHIADDRVSCLYHGDDMCIINQNVCSVNAICSSLNENYTCTCKDGFEGDGFTCKDINECERKEYKNCSIHGECTNNLGSYNCTCKTGWTGDGFNCTALAENFDEQLIYIIVGVIMALLVWLVIMIFCVWCCCFGGYKRYRTRHEMLTSTLDYDPYNVQQGFGSLSSTFNGRGRGRYYFGKFLGTKYLRNWAEFSPDAGEDPMPGTSSDSINQSSTNLSDSRWKRVLEKVNKTEVFHIDRPEISTRSYFS